MLKLRKTKHGVIFRTFSSLNISFTCSSQSWRAYWPFDLGVYHNLSLSSSYCENKTQIQGERNMQCVPGRPPIWMVKSQITRCGCPLLENLLNNFLREITEVSICVVLQNPHSQGRFPHLSPKKVKEEGWWKTETCWRQRVCPMFVGTVEIHA